MLKKNDSLPLSRVSSSARLQTASPSSFPQTPSYQSSNLNPNIRNNTRSIPPKTAEELEYETKFNELKIIKTVDRFEEKLIQLSQKVTSFQTNDLDQVVSCLIDINEELNVEIDKLEKHQFLKQTIEQLEQQRQHLDDQSKSILRNLLDYRTQLKSLPKVPTKPSVFDEAIASIDIDEVLKYGSKLSKFTKIPPSSNGVVSAHPNNFIWPAEDSLRRGMLAMSSLKSEEIIQKELGLGTEDTKVEEEVKPTQEAQETEKRTSRSQPKEKVEQPTLDIDLFDPENDDSD